MFAKWEPSSANRVTPGLRSNASVLMRQSWAPCRRMSRCRAPSAGLIPHPAFPTARQTLSCVRATGHTQIAAERARALDLQERLAALRATVAGQRRAMGGVNAARDGDLQARRHDNA